MNKTPQTSPTEPLQVSVLVQTPAYSQIAGALTYLSPQPLPAGTLVRVPLGQRELLGVVWDTPQANTLVDTASALDPGKLRPVTAVLDALAPLSPSWRALIKFAASYYQRSTGEVALAALPPQLREISGLQLARKLKKTATAQRKAELARTTTGAVAALQPSSDQAATERIDSSLSNTINLVALTPEQTRAINLFSINPGPFLLFGATGSGKTEVFMRCTADALSASPCSQVLVMVPEINLTPQLEERFQARFGAVYGQDAVVSMHSGMTPAQRLKSWLAAHSGVARIVLGTRMAVFASMPHLKLIVVDEEHDPSYKSGEGARYSARDLAVYRARLDGAKLILGSATPSLESWYHSRPAADGGRYQRLEMPSRIGANAMLPNTTGVLASTADGSLNLASVLPSTADVSTGAADELSKIAGVLRSTAVVLPSTVGALPRVPGVAPLIAPHATVLPRSAGMLPLVRRVDMNHQPKGCVISPPLLDAIGQRIARSEQSMVFLNRRGYAPVLSCSDCDWKSTCPHCSAYRVFHKIDRSLRCHHCGFAERVPRACPDCGSLDIAPVGRGTERLEEQLALLLSGITRPDGTAVRIARIDADTTRLKGSLETQLAQVHAGEVDVLVGTQMIAKGHDFRRITLVAAINPDGALFSSDFRSPERLFGLLIQAAGRAGRDASNTIRSEMWVQTFHPTHPLYEALKQHDYPAFAQSQLVEREQAGMPPFSFQALVRADARTQEAAQAFLNAASLASLDVPELAAWRAHVMLYPAVPMSIARVANVERAQMLLESPSRTALQRFLSGWQATLHATRAQPECKGLLRWAVDVDPLLI